MRSLFAMLCAAAVALPSPASAAALAMGPAAAESPEELYEEGRKDYRLGRFQDAIDKWERAYAEAELPLLLYNIALAYRQLYDVSADVEDLRKGKVVVKNFLVVAERDPDVDPADAKLLLEELDALIKEAEDRPAGVVPPPPTTDTQKDRPPPVSPAGKDPGRTHRIAGAATMGAGALFLVTGTALGITFAVRGRDFKDDLVNAQASQASGDPCMRADGQATDCDAAIGTARSNGRKANLAAALSFGLGGGLGLAAIATGAVLFVQGNKKSAAWSGKAAHLRVLPSGLGVTVSGRF